MGVRIVGQKPVLAGALRQSQILSSWPSETFEALVRDCEFWRYRRAETIAERGDEPTGLWVVISGSAKTFRSTVNGRYLLQGVHWPGDAFGVVAALDGLPLPHAHAARTDTVLAFVSRSCLTALLDSSAPASRRMAEFVCGRSRVDFESFYTTATESLHCRIAKAIAFLARRALLIAHGQPGVTDFHRPATVDLTQDELASMLGVVRQTLNRAMSTFLREKLLVREGDVIRVVKFSALLAYMEESEPLPEAWRNEILSWDSQLSDGLRFAGGIADGPRQGSPG